MGKITKEAALLYHSMGKPGKLKWCPPSLIPHKPTSRWLIHPA